MSVMNIQKLNAQIKSIGGNSSKLRDAIQEALISCAYHAVKDGQITPFNNLLQAVGTNTRIKGITMWAELYGFVRMEKGAFVLNKTMRKEAQVSDEKDFEVFENVMRSSPAWYDIAPKEKAVSIFDAEQYLNTVLTKLDKEGEAQLVEAIKTAVALYNLKQENAAEIAA